jgi:F0F1-type ATP synthase assembly protein I
MSQRPQRRHTSSRSQPTQKRRQSSSESELEDKITLEMGKNWYFQQTPMSQVYYLKVVMGLVVGFIIGIFYDIQIIANNWFIFPLICLMSIMIIARKFLNITKDDLDDLRLITWSGTISLFIAFIVSSILIHTIISPPQLSV